MSEIFLALQERYEISRLRGKIRYFVSPEAGGAHVEEEVGCYIEDFFGAPFGGDLGMAIA